jgi:glycosyltransferase involved in cell wall biosynthesis
LNSRDKGAATVVVVQPLIPDYRERFYRLLSQRLGSRLLLIAGTEDFAPALRHIDSVPGIRARNHYVLGRRLLWQSRVLRPAVRADIAVLVLNPRILTVWVVLVLRRLRGRRTVLWGHAWPRKGQESRTDRLRHLMRRLADTLVVYTETEARELRELMPGADVIPAPNALYSEDEMGLITPPRRPHDFVYVGRLVAAKKPGLLLEAFQLALPRLAGDVRLVFFGDGPLRAMLESKASQEGIQDRVVFAGHVSEIETLRRAYAWAIASVSPGYVGLSLIQSVGFGVPMLAARNEPHAPEIEAAVEGDNTYYFPSDSANALASALVSFADNRDYWLTRREEIATRTRLTYSVEAMVESFIMALRLDEQQPSDTGVRRDESFRSADIAPS